MAELDATQIRELTLEEMNEEIAKVRDELFRLRFRAAFEELENPSLLRTLRRDLARMLTIRSERLRAERETIDE